MFAIFDLDGTLLDTLRDIADSVNEVLLANGLPVHSYDAYKIFIGDGLTNLLIRALPQERQFQQKETVADFVRQARGIYTQKMKTHTKPYPGIEKMLGNLAISGIRLGVLSNKPDDLTQILVKHFFPDIPFSCVRGASSEFPIKPDPSSLLHILEKMNQSPGEGFFIGDTITDIMTANAAGVKSIGVNWGFRPLEIQKAGRVVSTPEEMETIMGL